MCHLALIHSDLLGDRPLEDTEKFRFRMRLPVVFSFTSHTVFSCPNQGPDRNSLLRLSRHKAERMEIILPGLLVHCPLLCVFPATLSVPLRAVVDLVMAPAVSRAKHFTRHKCQLLYS